MVTKLEKTLKREIAVDGRAYNVILSPDTLLITLKGHRKGKTFRWTDLIGDEAALAVALNASLGVFAKQAADSAEKPPARRNSKKKR
jgi:hypothetical protein